MPCERIPVLIHQLDICRLIATKGALHCRIGGKELRLEENVAVWIGPDVRHEFWVEEGEAPCEGILLMFGEGA